MKSSIDKQILHIGLGIALSVVGIFVNHTSILLTIIYTFAIICFAVSFFFTLRGRKEWQELENSYISVNQNSKYKK